MARVKRDLSKAICPECGKVGGIKEIRYGMPGEEFNFEKYIVGGCMPMKATIGCVKCEWAGMRKDLREN